MIVFITNYITMVIKQKLIINLKCSRLHRVNQLITIVSNQLSGRKLFISRVQI